MQKVITIKNFISFANNFVAMQEIMQLVDFAKKASFNFQEKSTIEVSQAAVWWPYCSVAGTCNVATPKTCTHMSCIKHCEVNISGLPFSLPIFQCCILKKREGMV